MFRRTPTPIQFDIVADLYDRYVRADFDIPFWIDRATSVTGKVLELACGTGRVSLPLLEAGVRLTCVDYAPGMLFQFRQKLSARGLSCPIFCQDMAELDLKERFDLVFIPFHSFSEIMSARRQRRALRKIHAHLAERGRFICTLHNPVVRAASMDGTMRPIGEYPLQDAQILRVSARMSVDRTGRVASGEQIYERFSADKSLIDRRILPINFCLITTVEMESMLTESGYIMESLLGDYHRAEFDERNSPFMIFTATAGDNTDKGK